MCISDGWSSLLSTSHPVALVQGGSLREAYRHDEVLFHPAAQMLPGGSALT